MKTNRQYIVEYTQLQKECDTLYHKAATELGLSDCAFWILYSLFDSQEEMKQSDICEAVSISRQTVNSALKKLEKDGYVKLCKIKGKIGKSIHLTEQGNEFATKKIKPLMKAEELACASFSEEEKETFLSIFSLLVNRLSVEINNSLEEK